jgi:hypothetical protein
MTRLCTLIELQPADGGQRNPNLPRRQRLARQFPGASTTQTVICKNSVDVVLCRWHGCPTDLIDPHVPQSLQFANSKSHEQLLSHKVSPSEKQPSVKTRAFERACRELRMCSFLQVCQDKGNSGTTVLSHWPLSWIPRHRAARTRAEQTPARRERPGHRNLPVQSS